MYIFIRQPIACCHTSVLCMSHAPLISSGRDEPLRNNFILCRRFEKGSGVSHESCLPAPVLQGSRMRTRHFGTGFVPLHVFWSARADCHAHIACIRLGLPFCIFRFRSPQYQLLSRLSAIFIFLKKSSHVNVKKNKNKANNKLIKGILLHGSRRVDSTVRAGAKIQGILTY